MKTAQYKGAIIRFSDYDIEDGIVYIKFGPYIMSMSEEDFNNLEITEE